MRATLLATIVIVVAAAALPAVADGARTVASLNSRCALAVTNVNVVPMDADRVLPDQTVLMDAGQILTVAPAAAISAAGCTKVIDGSHRYLLPGLNDLHMHVESAAFAQAFGVKSEPIDYPTVLALYIANGVTGLRVMSGAPDILAFRDSQRGHASPYPRLVVATPMLSGDPPVLPEPVTKIVKTAEEARAVVRDFKRQGYDFVKVRDNLKPPVLEAIIDEARQVGLYVDGHISRDQGLSMFDVLRLGQHAFAHIDDLVLHIKDEAEDPARLVAAFKQCDCFIETTLGIERNAIAQLENYDALAARPQMRFMHPLVVSAFWLKPNNPYLKEPAPLDFWRGLLAGTKKLLKTFIDADVHVVSGTDALNPMLLPGVSLHDEFDIMIEAGLTPYLALKTSTANAAAYVPGFADAGILATGRAATAILVDRNPLADITVLRDPAAVIINANFRDRAELHRMLEAAAARYGRK